MSSQSFKYLIYLVFPKVTIQRWYHTKQLSYVGIQGYVIAIEVICCNVLPWKCNGSWDDRIKKKSHQVDNIPLTLKGVLKFCCLAITFDKGNAGNAHYQKTIVK